MFFHFGIADVMLYAPESELAYQMTHKLYAVGLISLLTIIHMSIAFKVHKKDRSTLQHIVMRGSSLLIFLLNIVILWHAIGVRSSL